MIIRLNSKIYSKKAIKNAVDMFKKLASFKINEDKPYYTVYINTDNPAIKKVIKDEFVNYVLGLTKKCL